MPIPEILHICTPETDESFLAEDIEAGCMEGDAVIAFRDVTRAATMPRGWEGFVRAPDPRHVEADVAESAVVVLVAHVASTIG